MDYSRNMKVAARRHYRAADVLYTQNDPGDKPPCKAVAGYLFGIAGELAVKQILLDTGLRPDQEKDRRSDPFYAHFPELRSLLSTVTGRRSEALRRIAENPKLFRSWSVKMRYAPTTEIQPSYVDEWRRSAQELIRWMDTQ
jgi:hypothetical protein